MNNLFLPLRLFPLLLILTSCQEAVKVKDSVDPSARVIDFANIDPIHKANDVITLNFVSLQSNKKVESIKIEYSINNGAYQAVGTVNPGTSSYNFTVPSISTSEFRIRIRVLEFNGRTIDSVSRSFMVVSTVDTLAGQAYPQGSVDGDVLTARYVIPMALTRLGDDLYIVDQKMLKKINLSTNMVTNIAGHPWISGSLDGHASLALFDNLQAVATDGTDIYMADGTADCIRKYTVATNMVSTYAGLCGTGGDATGNLNDARFNEPYDLYYKNGYLYVADRANKKVKRINGSTVETVTTGSAIILSVYVDDNNWLFYGTDKAVKVLSADGTTATGNVITTTNSTTSSVMDGTGTAAATIRPSRIAGSGNTLYFTDYGCVIRKIVYDTADPSNNAVITTVAGTLDSCGDQEGNALAAKFGSPYGFYLDESNGQKLYFTSGNKKVHLYDIANQTVTDFSGPGQSEVLNYYYNSVAFLRNPIELTKVGDDLYFSNLSHTIRKFNLTTSVVTTICGKNFSHGNTDGSCSSARFQHPRGLAPYNGGLFVADYGNSLIRYIDSSLNVTTVAGTPGSSGATNQATGTGKAKFKSPVDICVKETATDLELYVTDAGNYTIRKIVFTGKVIPDNTTTFAKVTTLAGSPGVQGSTDAVGSSARFKNTWGIVCNTDAIYVNDTGNDIIRKVGYDGTVTTIAGSTTSSGVVDGIGTSASFETPTGIDSDGTYLYISQASGNDGAIRMINIATAEVTTISGGSNSGSTRNGVGASAVWESPRGLAVSGSTLYVAEYENHKLRSLDINTRSSQELVGGGGINNRDVAGHVDGAASTGTYPFRSGRLAKHGDYIYSSISADPVIRRTNINTGTTTIYAGNISETGSADGSVASARFASPYSLLVIGNYLYITELYEHVIRRIDLSTDTVETVLGVSGSSGNVNGVGTAARIFKPAALTTDDTYLYFTELDQYVIKRMHLETKEVTTLIGIAGSKGTVDGDSSVATFTAPLGIVYFKGQLYVADENTIRVIYLNNPSNPSVSTISGQYGVSGYQNGDMSLALYGYPQQLRTDGTYIYICDSKNSQIRRLNPETGIVSNWIGDSFNTSLRNGAIGDAQFSYPSDLIITEEGIFVTDQAGYSIRRIR
ncbi:MAG: hypothetical protein AB7I27_17250 [Bacteriovoracaceae bacterium]